MGSRSVEEEKSSFNRLNEDDRMFLEIVYEIAFGDDAINKDYSRKEVLYRLKAFSDKALQCDELEELITR